MTFLALVLGTALQYSVSPDSAFELPPPSAVPEPQTQAYPDYPPAVLDGTSGMGGGRWSRASRQAYDGAVYGTAGGALGVGIGFVAGVIYGAKEETPCGAADGSCGLGKIITGFVGAGIGGAAGMVIGTGIGVSRSPPPSYPSRTPIPGVLGATAGLMIGVGIAYGAESPALAPAAVLAGVEMGALVLDRTLARNNTSPSLEVGCLRPGLPGARFSVAF